MTPVASSFWRDRPVVVTGGAGFLGKAVVAKLERLSAEVKVIRSSEHDLRLAEDCAAAIRGADTVFHLAARVGGIGFNRRNPAPLAYDNLVMGTNVFEQSRLARIRKLVCACSVCAYPKYTPVPFKEADLWQGYPEESNAPYGLAKKMLLVLSDAYRTQYDFNSCAPIFANLYGPGDNYDLEDSHVIAALLRKFVDAAESNADEVVLWGTGQPSREFLFVEDAAAALILAGEHLDTSEPVNIGTGKETRINELASTIQQLVGYAGTIRWDSSRPDGQPARYLDVTQARALLGFEAQTGLEDGLQKTLQAYRETDRAAVNTAG